jgi:hypothetical protein
MRRTLLVLALLGAALAVTTRPAAAESQAVQFRGPVEAGQTLELRCPDGYRVQLTLEGELNTSAYFYRNSTERQPIATAVPPDATVSDPAGNVVGVSWLVPNRAKYAVAGVVCEPIPTTTVITASGVQVADEWQRVDCPPAYPYITSTFTFTGDADGDLSTTSDQFPLQSRFLLYLVGNDPGVPNYTGFQFRLDPGMAWTAEVTCSITPGQ